MQLDPDGAQHFPAVFSAARIDSLRAFFSSRGESARLAPAPGLAEQLRPATDLVGRFLPSARPVFARWFDKSPTSNWSLGWHQDRTVPLAERGDVAGFCQWTVKAGIPHAVPPFEILAGMLTLRLHLDAVDEANAPLLIAPGSHRRGLVPEAGIAAAVARCGTRACLAKAGDAWLYAAPILHASARARSPARRRVLQIAYSADRLLGGLEWAGV
jgi:hypothetical protein